MKKKLVLLLTGCMLAMSLVACGGKTEGTAATPETTTTESTVEESTEPQANNAEYTEEQLAFIDEFNQMVEEYNVAVDTFNASPLVDIPDLATTISKASPIIEAAKVTLSNPANLTPEVMTEYRTLIGNIYGDINTIYMALNDVALLESGLEDVTTTYVDPSSIENYLNEANESEYTSEQLDIMNEFEALVKEFSYADNLVSEKGLWGDPNIKESLMTITNKIDTLRGFDVETMTEEDMNNYRNSFDEIYDLLDELYKKIN